MPDQLSIPALTAELKRVRALTAEPAKAADGGLLDCLRRSLHAAIKLEFATIPPYLTAKWSIRDSADPVAATIKEIAIEEMLHMGLACNMLVGLGAAPVLNTPDLVPIYPGPLPGDVNPALTVPLRRLTPSQLKVFMDIEYPEGGPITETAVREFDTIGAFYAALLDAFEAADPRLDITKQREEAISGLFVVRDLADVRRAIDLIRRQGEGSNSSPEETAGHLAHFYQFREVYVGAKYVKNPETKTWGHDGAPVLMPAVWPMADIPRGGYQRADVPDDTVWTLIRQFDTSFRTMLNQLQRAWEDPAASLGDFSADDPVLTMTVLTGQATELVQKPRPDGMGNYGPSFRVV